MKISILLLPILAGLGMARTIIIKEQALEQEGFNALGCCPATPCLIGCWVGGVWQVSSYCLTDRAYNC
jgi:hypothetical protein